MKTYDPEWKEDTKGKAHLIARDTNRIGHNPRPRTLCGRSAKKIKLSAFQNDIESRCDKCKRELVKVRAALIGDSNIVVLEERTFAGPMCPGAFHWSGSLSYGSLPKLDLTFAMTYLQARAENKRDPSYQGWEAGSISSRFFTREDLRAKAVETVRDHEPSLFPGAMALVAGQSLNPGELLWTPYEPGEPLWTKHTTRITEVWEAWDQAQERGDYDVAEVLDTEYAEALRLAGLVW